jgi:hypothetical protein
MFFLNFDFLAEGVEVLSGRGRGRRRMPTISMVIIIVIIAVVFYSF